jgi:hypothetical protein
VSQAKIDPKIAREALWRRGHLSWLLDANQQSLYKLFHENAATIQTWLLARRSGKSFALCVLSIEYCIKNPNSVIKYVAPTKDQVENFILPIIDNDILHQFGCPDDIKPSYIRQKKQYRFPNGSTIQLCGAESGNIDSIRGGFAHIAIIDEAQDVSKLSYAISSVLLPTLLTTKGKLLISGTPPQDQDHEFLKVIEDAEARGTLIRRTVFDNPRLTKDDIKQISDAMGGEHTEEFQREFLCKIIKSKSRSVLPEVTDDLLKDIVKEWTRPPYYNSFTSMDVGLKDWTVVLFGYYDFRADKIVIEDELVAYGPEMHLPVLTADIKKKEEGLWTNPVSGEFQKPLKRISDHNLIVINEIKKFSNYSIIFELADKKDKMAGINWLRTLLSTGKIIISPKCVTLIRHLKDGKWKNGNKEDFSQCPFGSHYDGIDALVYLVRGIDYKHNPYPKDYQSPLRAGDAHYTASYEKNTVSNPDVYKKLLNIKPNKNERKTSYTDILNKNREKK